MGTDIYMGITITGAPEGLLSQLPDFELLEAEGWMVLQDHDSTTQTFVDVPGGYHVYGVGRYDDEQNMIHWAREFTAKHPEATLLMTEEWHADEGGMEENIYRGGDLIAEDSKVNGMVPLLLSEYLDAGKRALVAYHMPVGDEQTVIEGLVNALQRLVDKLD